MQFLCPNCRIISEISKIEVDELKRNKSKDVQQEIENLESEIEKEEGKRWPKESYIRRMSLDIMDKTVLKKEYETKFKYIKCPVCTKRHYIES